MSGMKIDLQELPLVLIRTVQWRWDVFRSLAAMPMCRKVV
ncbi:hypothetical protein A2U01_0086676, partial [Trifolium medium]|nr:hypothetical protein [Trifolium medium]